jgi:hypothetical protein
MSEKKMIVVATDVDGLHEEIARLKAENKELVGACRDAASEFVRLGEAHGIYCLATHSKLTEALAQAEGEPK